jgi:type I restriction enzyme S subunit
MFDGPFGSALKTADYTDHGVRVARLENIGHLRFREELKSFVSQAKADSLRRHLLAYDDVLFSSFVDQETRVCLVPQALDGRMINKADCFCVRTDRAICNARFLAYKLAAPSSHERFSGSVRGITRPRIGLRDLAAFKIDLPPLAEQRRIVAKLDMLCAGLVRARAEVERIPELAVNLRRQCVCKAFDGSLTVDWRASNKGILPATDDELSHAYAAETGFRRKKPAAEIDWRPAVGLPTSWRWVSIDQLVAEVQYGSSAKTSSDDSGVPVLRMGNIQRGTIDWTDLKYLPKDHNEFPDLLLREGDVLFNRTNSFELVGKTAAIRKLEQPASFASYLIKLRPIGMLAELLAYYLNSPFARRWVDQVASQQVGQANVNGSKLKALGIPLPPREEQVEMLSRINNAMSHADRLESEAARARVLLDRLEAAILTRAFRGELVPQDPNDEPAGVLLERVRAQRAAAAPASKPKRRGRLSPAG